MIGIVVMMNNRVPRGFGPPFSSQFFPLFLVLFQHVQN